MDFRTNQSKLLSNSSAFQQEYLTIQNAQTRAENVQSQCLGLRELSNFRNVVTQSMSNLFRNFCILPNFSLPNDSNRFYRYLR